MMKKELPKIFLGDIIVFRNGSSVFDGKVTSITKKGVGLQTIDGHTFVKWYNVINQKIQSGTIRVKGCYNCPFSHYDLGDMVCKLILTNITQEERTTIPSYCPLRIKKMIVEYEE